MRIILFFLILSGCTGLAEAINNAVPDYNGAVIESVTLLTIPPSKPDGSGWDLGSAADPYVLIQTSGGAELYRSEPVEDARPGQYPLRFSVPDLRLGMNEGVFVSIYDEDVSDDDGIVSYPLRLADVGGLIKPDVLPLLGTNGEPMVELRVRWTES